MDFSLSSGQIVDTKTLDAMMKLIAPLSVATGAWNLHVPCHLTRAVVAPPHLATMRRICPASYRTIEGRHSLGSFKRCLIPHRES